MIPPLSSLVNNLIELLLCYLKGMGEGGGIEILRAQSVMINYKPRPRCDDHRNNCNQRLFIIEFTSLK